MSTTEQEPLFFLRGGEHWRDPFPAYRRLRDESPVHRVQRLDGDDFYVLSRFQDVFDAARNTGVYSSAHGLTPDADAMDMFEDVARPIVMMDPPEHTAMRRLVSRALTPRRVSEIGDMVGEFVDEKLDLIADAGHVDLIEMLAKPLPSFVVAHYLGVPLEDRVQFDRWSQAIVAANAENNIGSAMDAAMELFGYGNTLIERRRVDPGDDLVSDLVAVGEETASAMWIVGFVFTMITGGNDTMTGLMGGAAELLTDHRDQRQQLLDDRSLIGGSIDEFLRLTCPVQNLARTTLQPVTVHDVEIPEGTKVMLLYGAANRDEREFGLHPDELDVQRQIDRILSFGWGPHHCLGAAAARLVGTVSLERLLSRFPDFVVDSADARFAPGAFVRRYQYLPFAIDG